MTPAEKAGLKVGDKIKVITYAGTYLKPDDILEFVRDDCSDSPWFSKVNREPGDLDEYAFNVVDHEWEKLEEKAMNKIERIEEMEKQLSALKAEVESESKPKRVRVYIKEDAEDANWDRIGWDDEMEGMLGKVYSVSGISGRGSITVLTGEGDLDYLYFPKSACIIVEGSLEDLK